MGFPEHGDDRDRLPYLDADRADDLKQRVKDEGRWPPRIPVGGPDLLRRLDDGAATWSNNFGLADLLRDAAAEIRRLLAIRQTEIELRKLTEANKP